MADASPASATRPPIRAEIAGNQIEVIERGEDRLHALLALITGAATSIKMLMYMFNPDHAGGVASFPRFVGVNQHGLDGGLVCRTTV